MDPVHIDIDLADLDITYLAVAARGRIRPPGQRSASWRGRTRRQWPRVGEGHRAVTYWAKGEGGHGMRRRTAQEVDEVVASGERCYNNESIIQQHPFIICSAWRPPVIPCP